MLIFSWSQSFLPVLWYSLHNVSITLSLSNILSSVGWHQLPFVLIRFSSYTTRLLQSNTMSGKHVLQQAPRQNWKLNFLFPWTYVKHLHVSHCACQRTTEKKDSSYLSGAFHLVEVKANEHIITFNFQHDYLKMDKWEMFICCNKEVLDLKGCSMIHNVGLCPFFK